MINKKYIGILATTLFIIILTVFISAALTKYEYYTAAPNDQDGVSQSQILAENFTIGTTGTNESFAVSIISLNLAYGGVIPNGTLRIELRNGSYTSTVIAVGSIDATGLNNYGSASDCLYKNVSLTTNPELAKGKQYTIVATSWTSNATNNWKWCEQDASGYNGGEGYKSTNNGSSWSAIGTDFNFEVWGTSSSDTTPPAVSSLVTSPINGSDYNPSVITRFNATITDTSTIDTVKFQLDNVNYTLTGPSGSVYNKSFTGLSAGIYSYYWWANDSIGNINNTESGTYTILKNSSFVLTITGTTPITFGHMTDVAGGGCPSALSCSLSPANSNAFPVGTQTFNYSTSGNGNYSSGSITKVITINADIFPAVNITNPQQGKIYNAIPGLNYSTNDTNLDTCKYSINNGVTNTTITCGTNVTGLTATQGNNTWTVYVNDSDGNKNQSSVTFFYDNVNPTAFIVSPINGKYYNYTNINFSANLSEIIQLSEYSVYVAGAGTEAIFLNQSVAQNFTIGASGPNIDFTLGYISIWLAGKTWSDNLTVSLRNGSLTGPVIGTTFNKNVTTFMSNAVADSYLSQQINISLGNVELNKNNKYYIVINSTSEPAAGYDIIGTNTIYNGGNRMNIALPSGTVTQHVESLLFAVYTKQNQSSSSGLLNATLTVKNNATEAVVNSTDWTFSNLWDTIISSIITLVDGVYDFTVTVYDNAKNYYTTNVLQITIDTISPSLIITSPASNIGIVPYGNYNINIDSSVNETNVANCWTILNGVTTTYYTTCNGTNYYNNSLSIIVLGRDLHNNIQVFVNDSTNKVINANTTYDLIFEKSVDYNQNTFTGATLPIEINISYPSSIYTGITGLINYNNTEYTMISSGSGDNISLSTAITIIGNTSADDIINQTFYYTLSLSNTTSILSFNSSLFNLSVSPFFVDNCTNYSNKVFNFEIKDEETLVNMNGTINVAATFYSADRTTIAGTWNGTIKYNPSIGNASICAANITGVYSTDYTAQFYGNQSLYFVKYNTLQNFTLTNQTLEQNITLYDLLLNSGNTFQIYVRGSPIGNNGLLVDIQKQYLAQNKFISVESYVTDNDGNAVAHLTQASAIYNFIVSKNGRVLGTFNNYQVKCANALTGDCSIILNLYQTTADEPDFYTSENVSGTYLLNQNSSTLFFTYSAVDSQIHNVSQIVSLNDGYSNVTICNKEGIGVSGTLTCNIPSTYSNTTFYAITYVDGQYAGTRIFSLGGVAPDFHGVDIFAEILMYSTLVLLFIGSPVMIIIGAMIGIVMAISLVLLSGASFGTILSVIIYFICAGVLVIIKIGRNR